MLQELDHSLAKSVMIGERSTLPRIVIPSYIPGGNREFVSGRLNYHFGRDGPAFGIDTACSFTAASMNLACAALVSNRCDAAIAGGGNIMTAPDLFAGLSRGGIVSPSGSCRTWDSSADRYCRADAVGVSVLQ